MEWKWRRMRDWGLGSGIFGWIGGERWVRVLTITESIKTYKCRYTLFRKRQHPLFKSNKPCYDVIIVTNLNGDLKQVKISDTSIWKDRCWKLDVVTPWILIVSNTVSHYKSNATSLDLVEWDSTAVNFKKVTDPTLIVGSKVSKKTCFICWSKKLINWISRSILYWIDISWLSTNVYTSGQYFDSGDEFILQFWRFPCHLTKGINLWSILMKLVIYKRYATPT